MSARTAAVRAAIASAEDAAHAAARAARAAVQQAREAERRGQSDLLRCIFGFLPNRPVALDPKMLTWHNQTIPKLAESIYQDRDLLSGHLKNLPILADVLEDAGCTDPDLLGHFRRPGVHVRGCWVLDLLLRKE
jgi:hypothetical protein